MGLVRRFGNMVRGFFGLYVSRLEEKNPELLFEDIRNEVEKSRKEAEQQILEIQTSAELIKIEMKNSERNLNATKARLEAAQKKKDMEILVEVLMQEEEAQATFDTLKTIYNNAMVEVEKIREDFKVFESEMNLKCNELRTLKSQARMASLKENINSVNAKYTSKNNRASNINENMDRVREIVNIKTARANAVEALKDDSIEMKLKRLDIGSARDRARLKAEVLLSSTQDFEAKG